MPTPGEKRALIFLASVAALGVAVRGWQTRDGAAAGVGDKAGLARQIGLVDSAIASGGGRKRGKSARANAVRDSAANGDPATTTTETGSVTGKPKRTRRGSATTVPDPIMIPSAPPNNRAAYFALREREDSARARLRARTAAGSSARTRSGQRTRESAPVDLDVANEEEIASVAGIGPALAHRIVADRIANGPFGSFDELRRVRVISAALARRIAPTVTFSLSPVTARASDPPPRAPTTRRRRSPTVPQP